MPPGFTPVSQEPGYVPKIKGRSVDGLAARANPQNAIVLSIDKAAKSLTCSPALYPTSVVCAKLVETITTKTLTKTASTTSTTTLSPSTQTTTSTVKTSVTVKSTPPDVTTTSTVTTFITLVATTTATTTTTTTSTVTQTVEVPGATSYAACAANNVVNSANGGQGIYAISLTNQALTFVSTTASSAYDCCVQCETTSQNCVGSFFYYISDCMLIVQTSCMPGAFTGASFGTGPFPPDGGFTISNGPCGAIANNGGTQLGELTDKGRETTLSLGTRLRHLYVKQLKFMPKLIASADMIYLRATPMPRALESVQQTFWGMYPLTARTASFPPPTIVTRTPADETLFPNDGNCRRFNQLSRAFAQRTADRWNESDQVAYLNKLISKWMPDSSPRVAVDSHPRLSGVMDTINSTLAHGPETRLPSEFYDPKLRSIVSKIGVEEWFSGYAENREYRTLGIGALVGDILERMSASIEHTGLSVNEIGGEDGNLGRGRDGETCIKFAMSGCHDTTLAAILTSLGAFDDRPWPPYTSHLAIEMFRKKQVRPADSSLEAPTPSISTSQSPGLFSLFRRATATSVIPNKTNICRRPYASLTSAERQRLEGFYVRMRYNDEPVAIPGCASPGNHLEGNETFCTLDAFKRIVDEFVPRDWKKECQSNMNGVINGIDMGAPEEKAGWEAQGANEDRH
ncbi:MAG: hypothetical protein Q9160_007005 [Pyrenula sp. 1 TL-2023]